MAVAQTLADPKDAAGEGCQLIALHAREAVREAELSRAPRGRQFLHGPPAYQSRVCLTSGRDLLLLERSK